MHHSLTHNLQSAGYPIREIIHVDNGSEGDFADWFQKQFLPAIQIRHKENLGVAKGYNHGLLMTTSSHIVITGCDRIMPEGWLATWVDCFQKIPNTGAISQYTAKVGEDKSMRTRGELETINGIEILPSIVCEARMHSREYLLGVGFFREDFGLYGYEDCEWADRAEVYARNNGLINYILPSQGYAIHLDFENHGDYLANKTKDTEDPRKPALVKYCHAAGSPHYNPYCRLEPNLLERMEIAK